MERRPPRRCVPFLFFLAMIAGFPAVVSEAKAEGPGGVKSHYASGETRNRFQAWEKRARRFEAALTEAYAPAQLEKIAARLEMIAADIAAEANGLRAQYDAALAAKRRTLTGTAAREGAARELGYGPDDLRYAQNVRDYARGLAERVRRRAKARAAP